MHVYFLINALVIYVLSSSTILATCVVVTRTDTQIIVGADSRRQVFSAEGTFKEYTNIGCKIRQCGKFFYTLVGVNDVLQIHHANLLAGENLQIDNLINTYAERMSYDYNIYINGLRNQNIELFNNNFYPYNIFTEMAFVGIENDVPQVRIIEFCNTNLPDAAVNVRFRIKTNPPLVVLGYKSSFNKLTSEAKYEMIVKSKTNSIGVIKELIENQEKLSPKEVGTPIDILQIDSKGPVWVARKPECMD
ncbi:hypothetical protein [Spirosoma flavum]|uniref:Uncharacterized protein n=1 Tax=Spirosoma flavum TaxID=2048557 RepID=A0ABW6ANV7_9BACT